MKDAIRFEYKRPERRKLSGPPRRSMSLDRRKPSPAPIRAQSPPKPSRSFSFLVNSEYTHGIQYTHVTQPRSIHNKRES